MFCGFHAQHKPETAGASGPRDASDRQPKRKAAAAAAAAPAAAAGKKKRGRPKRVDPAAAAETTSRNDSSGSSAPTPAMAQGKRARIVDSQNEKHNPNGSLSVSVAADTKQFRILLATDSGWAALDWNWKAAFCSTRN